MLTAFVGALALAIIARSTVIPSDWHFVFNVGIGAFSLGVARLAGLSADDLGCARRNVGSGLRHGALAFVAVTIAVSSVAPFGLLDDDRTTIGAGEMLLRVLVVIPIGTVLVEELTFRGTLHGLLDRTTTPTRSLIAGSVLFGVWHVAPILDDGAWVVLGTVLATTVAGAAFIWLRRRSGSLIAPILAHIATNSATFALSWAANR